MADILSISPGTLECYYKFGETHNVVEFPSAIDDNFNRADQNPVDPAIWQPRSHFSAIGTPRPMKIESNKLVAVAASGNPSYGVYLPGGVMTDCEAYVTVGEGWVYPATAKYAGVVVRYQPGVAGDYARGYAAVMAVGNTQASGHATGVLIVRLGNPTVTLGGGTSSPPNIFPGDKIGLQVEGNVVTAWQYRMATGLWTRVGRWVDSTYASGYCGVYGDPTVTVDDFGCGPLVVTHPTAWPFPGVTGASHYKYDWLLDYSGKGRHLAAQQAASVTYGANPPTFKKMPGAGYPDDGSVQFNLGYFIWVGPFSQNSIGLEAPGFSPGEYVGVQNLGTTHSFWLKAIPSAPPDSWAPSSSPYTTPIISTRYRGFSAVPYEGWAWWINSGTGELSYTCATNQGFPSGGWSVAFLPFGVWKHVMMRLTPVVNTGPSNTWTWRREFIINDEVVLEIEGLKAVVAPIPSGYTDLQIGGALGDDLRYNLSRFGIDEFALWSSPVDLAAKGITLSFTDAPMETPEWTQVDDRAGV